MKFVNLCADYFRVKLLLYRSMVRDLSIKTCLVMIAVLLVTACKSPQEEEEPVTAPVAHELPFADLVLDDLSAFKEPAEHWSIVDNVFMDRTQDHNIEVTEGKSILICKPQKGTAPLSTRAAYGDLDLKIDFMLSKGSGAKIFFQGRYAILLADSWKKDSVTSADCGGVYPSSDQKTGIAPALNACKAPGLWQHLYVKFRAPRFDATGKKIADAVMEEVILNGKCIQKNVVFTEPDAGAPFRGEQAAGPLVLVSDNGPVAFQHIQYKTYGYKRIVLRDLKFDVYKGLYKVYDTLKKLTPQRTGVTDSLHWNAGDKRAQIVFKGSMQVPAAGDYLFVIKAGGPAWLLIDGQEIVNNRGTREYTEAYYGNAFLTEGNHALEVIYANYDESLVVQYEGPGIPLTMLTSPSAERHNAPADPLDHSVKNEPGMQRGFFMHHGKVNPYTMAVGIPGGLNYAYDLTTYSMLSVWRGKFIDVSNMWTERGESQLEIPLGAPLELPGVPGLLHLADEEDVWQDTVQADNNIYIDRGYRLGENGLPVFFYTYDKVHIEEQVLPAPGNAGFIQKITATMDQPVEDLYFLLGRGKLVEKLPNGAYAIGDKEYYIESLQGVDEKQLIIVKVREDGYELLLPLSAEASKTVTFNYTIIW